MTVPVDKKTASPLGKGKYHPAESLQDSELHSQLIRYRRGVASAYSSVSPDDIGKNFSSGGSFHISPKVDGELWFLVLDGKEPFLASPRGAVIQGDIPLLEEAKTASKLIKDRTVIAGELFAAAKSGDDRPRVSDVASALGGGAKAPVDRLGFMAFDLVQVSDEASEDEELQSAEGKSAAMEELLSAGKRLKVVPYKVANAANEISDLFEEWVAGGKAEGLVVRIPSGRIFKIKPEITIDAVVVGYTERREAPDQVGSVSLALMHEDGIYQFIGSCGTIGSEDERADLHKRLSKVGSEANFRKASSGGALYKFVRPEVIVEIKASDVQSRDASDKSIRHMYIEHGDKGWAGRRPMPGGSLIHAVLTRVRDDKAVTPEEIRFEQLRERCFIEEPGEGATADDLPKSELLRREVYTKETKGQVAVRKLLVWKTNKEEASDEHPAFVVHWTDYSPGRKDPIKRTVRPTPSKKTALSVGDKIIEDNIKKGWSNTQDS